ncbi:MAG TPA: hypothetical protein VGP62_23905 [Bryobacteraceae bacterium]|jgi:hypothetical protein|nr:hypothetical protein [Bryobacteraceae bacterium]
MRTPLKRKTSIWSCALLLQSCLGNFLYCADQKKPPVAAEQAKPDSGNTSTPPKDTQAQENKDKSLRDLEGKLSSILDSSAAQSGDYFLVYSRSTIS